MNSPIVSVVIPLWVASGRFFHDLERFNELDYPNFEVLIVSDREIELPDGPFRLVLTGIDRTGPAEKRDTALREARGDILAFIDDDAYPRRDWILNAVRHFDDPEIYGVGGPGITPPEDSFRALAGGAVYESYFGSGPLLYRFRPVGKLRFVDDFPAYNLFFRKEALEKIGGWGSTFYGGEDTKVCLEVVKSGGKLLYDPEVIVYHHHRELFGKHLQQISNVGLHRGYFVKKYPETSRRLLYFLPSVFSVGYLAFFVLSFVSNGLRNAFWICTAVVLALFFISAPARNPLVRGMAAVGILFHHIFYGLSFIKGLFKRELKR